MEYGVEELKNSEAVQKNQDKARVLKHRDMNGRPVIYIPAKNHNSTDRDIDELTKFIVHCLVIFLSNFFPYQCLKICYHFVIKEEACNRCFEEVIDNLCIVFDLTEFAVSNLDYQLVKNLIWLLSKHYPERLGVCIILNAPSVFSTIFPVIKGWLNENTSEKVGNHLWMIPF